MKIELKATRLFYKNLEAKGRIVVNMGGAGAGKSWAILQLLLYKFLTEKNKRILIVRKTLPSLRVSTLDDFEHLLDSMGVRPLITVEKQFLNYKYKDNLIHFASIDNPEKIKSSKWSYIFMEEANEFSYGDYSMLKLRLRHPSIDGKRNQIFIAFNPIDEKHWLKYKLIDKEQDLTFIHSTYKDNSFLEQDYIDMLESIPDPNQYRVYVLGEWGRPTHLIFQNWQTVARTDFPDETMYHVIYGVDFGYSAPSAVVRCYVPRNPETEKSVYVEEILYKVNLTNEELIAAIKKVISEEHYQMPFYCDSAEPDRIKEFRQAGINAKKAYKDVRLGIDILKRYNIKILDNSKNLIRELRGYRYKLDKDGDPVEEPDKICDSHAIDAMRYACATSLRKGAIKSLRVLWV